MTSATFPSGIRKPGLASRRYARDTSGDVSVSTSNRAQYETDPVLDSPQGDRAVTWTSAWCRHAYRRGRRGVLPLSALALVTVLLATGCSSDGAGDELQVVENPVAAQAAHSPPPATRPIGTVLPHSAGVSALAIDEQSRTLAIALEQPTSVLLYNLDDLGAEPRQVPLPGGASRLVAGTGEVVATLPAQHQVARIAVPEGRVNAIDVDGEPAAARPHGEGMLVALRDRKAIEVRSGGAVTKTITGELYSADDVLTAGDTTLVLDRLRTAVFQVDLEQGTVQQGLRAGQGATNATVDRHGRVLVTDTRADALLAFGTDPLLLRQRYPVPGGAYGVAYDGKRDLAWVTLTERNEVVGYDVHGGEPVEKHRYPTVRQPNSVTVDAQTSRVIVGSAVGEGTQVIEP